MNPEEKSALAEKYLAKESLALQEWYQEFQTQETGVPGPEVSSPNLEKIKRTFDAWYEQSREQLVQIICREWGYCEKRNGPEFQSSVSFVVALADFFVAKYTNFPSPLALSAMIVLKGLDKLCKC